MRNRVLSLAVFVCIQACTTAHQPPPHKEIESKEASGKTPSYRFFEYLMEFDPEWQMIGNIEKFENEPPSQTKGPNLDNFLFRAFPDYLESEILENWVTRGDQVAEYALLRKRMFGLVSEGHYENGVFDRDYWILNYIRLLPISENAARPRSSACDKEDLLSQSSGCGTEDTKAIFPTGTPWAHEILSFVYRQEYLPIYNLAKANYHRDRAIDGGVSRLYWYQIYEECAATPRCIPPSRPLYEGVN